MTKRYSVHVNKDRIVACYESQPWEFVMNFTQVFVSYHEMIEEGRMSVVDGALLLRLATIADRNNLIAMTDAVLAEHLSLNYTYTRTQIHRLIKAGALYRVGKGKLFINPCIVHRTNFSNWCELFEYWFNLPIKPSAKWIEKQNKSKTSQESGTESA